MAESLIAVLLGICTVVALVVRDAIRRGGVSAGHIGVFLFASLAIVAAPAAWNPNLGGRCTSPKNACINNLWQIDGAKQQWALENHIEAGAPSIAKEVNAYLKGGGPKCSDGGTYTYGKVDEPPRCSIKEHTLK